MPGGVAGLEQNLRAGVIIPHHKVDEAGLGGEKETEKEVEQVNIPTLGW